MIGGLDFNDDGEITPKIVEIDESKFFRRKYHRGRWREGHWVFGGIERRTQKCFLVRVEQRNADTLLPLIEQWIQPGTHIMSDGWAAYNGIENIGGGIYSHEVIIHEDNFVDPNNRRIHTQNVESMWARAKRVFKRNYGTSGNLFETYLSEFMWREKYGNSFSSILVHICEQYEL